MSKSKASSTESVKVVVRCRPLNRMETENNDPMIVSVNQATGSILVKKLDTEEKKQFTFDCAFPPGTAQVDVFNQTAKAIVDSVLGGYNGTIFAYGQTGTGKTFSMEGDPENSDLMGIMPRSFAYVFDAVNGAVRSMEFLVRVSFLEIYKDDVFDLLNKSTRCKMEVKESKERGVYVKDLSVYNVKAVADMMQCLRVGQKSRKVGATKMNEGSSRSHSIFSITIESSETDDKGVVHYKVGKLNLVDLAGSERQKKTEATGERLDEAKSINWSLMVLGNCIKALIDPHAKHVPFRDSKLTRLLQDSLGGNTKTVMIANIGPAASNFEETISTLRYADRAKQIKNKPTINEDPKDAMLRGMQEEIALLKAQLEARAKGIPLSALLSQRAQSGVADASNGEGETMVDVSQLPPELIEERIVEKVVIEDTGITEEELKTLEGKTQEEIDAFLQEKEKEKKLIEEKAKMTEQTTLQLAEVLQKKDEILSKEQQELMKLQQALQEKEKQLLVGGEQVDKAHQQKKELKLTEEELLKRRSEQEKLLADLKEAEEAELYMNQHYASTQEEIQVKTNKLKKLWSKYQEKKNELEEMQSEFSGEREDLIDTIRSLDRQLKLKNLLLDSFIPMPHLQLIEKNSHFDAANDQWLIRGVEYAGNVVARDEADDALGQTQNNRRHRNKHSAHSAESYGGGSLIHAADLNQLNIPLGINNAVVSPNATLVAPADRPVYFSYSKVLNNNGQQPGQPAGQARAR